MPIIKDWIFIHIPRTGGTYIESLFGMQWQQENDDENNEGNKNKLFGVYKQNSLLFTLQHLTALELHIHFKEYEKYKKFTIVRNPYHRILSLWLQHKPEFENYNFIDFLNLLYEKKVFEYNHYCGRVGDDYIDDIKYHFIPQHFYTHDENNEQLVDNIFFYEEDKLQNFIDSEFGVKISFQQQKTDDYYEKFLDKDVIQMINTIYESDFKFFNYTLK